MVGEAGGLKLRLLFWPLVKPTAAKKFATRLPFPTIQPFELFVPSW